MSKNRDQAESLNALKLTMAFYCELMTEIKIRERAIATMLAPSLVPAQVTYESCFLQLRMICELIAIACLLVHGDIEATKTKKMKATWEADRIIKRLGELHQNFYPRPVVARGKNGERIENLESGFLTKDDLVTLYTRKCGKRLHRGAVKDVRHRINPSNVKLDHVEAWRQKIVRLLQHHWISVHDSPDHIGVQMNEIGKSPQWHFWKALQLDEKSVRRFMS